MCLQNFLHVYLAQDPSFLSRPEEAMTRTCRRLDQEVLELCHRQGLYCGTTAIMVLIRLVHRSTRGGGPEEK